VLTSETAQFSHQSSISPLLKNVVTRFWQVDRHSNTHIRETIIPKGSVEIIFSFHDDNLLLPGQIGPRKFKVPRCFISGYNTVPINVDIPGRQLFFGVELTPTALRKLFRLPGREYANRCMDLRLVDDSINSLWHELAEQKNFEHRINIFTNWMIKRLPVTSRHEQLFDDFLTTVSCSPTKAEDVSKMLCYSPRHLSRKLLEITAMNLEQTLIYKRYLRAVDLMHHSHLRLTEIAHVCDFSDQSHLTKTFRSFTNMKPTQYRATKSNVSGHIFEVVR
jgi:AraC-like DNA-binding protein